MGYTRAGCISDALSKSGGVTQDVRGAFTVAVGSTQRRHKSNECHSHLMNAAAHMPSCLTETFPNSHIASDRDSLPGARGHRGGHLRVLTLNPHAVQVTFAQWLRISETWKTGRHPDERQFIRPENSINSTQTPGEGHCATKVFGSRPFGVKLPALHCSRGCIWCLIKSEHSR